MAGRVQNCPNCGGQVTFRADTSLLAICPYCSSAVARTGDDIGELEILGKVAPLADLGSPLSIGVAGRHKGRAFTLIGRLQLDYGAGPWNEWYAAFDDGTWGWVAEAQGKVYLTFGKPLPDLPSYEAARVGAQFRAGQQKLTVVERRRARFVAAEGELPHAVTPGEYYFYCDVEGEGGVFGTLDYGDKKSAPFLYLGQQLEYKELFDKSVLRNVEPARAAGAAAMNCPNCGAGVALRAPDESQRVSCSACDALLDCSKGTQLYLLSAAKHQGPLPQLEVGSDGKFFGYVWTIYGHLSRSVTIEGVRYFWEEYLLKNDTRGYRWLVVSDGHWSWVEPASAGDVDVRGNVVQFRGKMYRHFQSASAKVESIRGEFYWKIALGERVSARDFVCPPMILSEESSDDEVTWSHGQYLEPEAIEAAFKTGALPRPRGVAPHQPNRWLRPLKATAKNGAIATAALAAAAVSMAATSDNKLLFEHTYDVVPRSATTKNLGAPISTEPFVVNSRSNLSITVLADVPESWLFADGTLADTTTGQREHFGVMVRHFGEFELAPGAKAQKSVFVGDVAKGNYALTLLPEWNPSRPAPTKITVEVREDVFFASHFFTALILLWLLPIVPLLGYHAFEKQRWLESDHG